MEKNNTLEKTMDIAGSAIKLAANLSEAKKEPPKPQPFHQTDDNSNKASTGSQTVVVSMDGKKKEPKPVEKHIHEFQELRTLTTEECEGDQEHCRADEEFAQHAFARRSHGAHRQDGLHRRAARL